MTTDSNISTQKLSAQYLLLAIFGVFILVLWYWLQENKLEENRFPDYFIAIFWVLVLIFLLWLGNSLIYNLLQQVFPWEKTFIRRFYLQLLSSFIYSLACINLSYYLFKTNFTAFPPDQAQMILVNIYSIIFLLPVLSLQFGFFFLYKWKKAIVEHEVLKKEQIQTELITLKSHLSPHFLFNNLNILSSLIEPENDTAQDFLDRFSEVYRYVLKNRETELVELSQELTFLDAYSYLLRNRFEKGLEIQTEIEDTYQTYMLPPLALQMTLENALKHNKLSEKAPLNIKIFTESSANLIIQNNLQIREVPAEEKTAFGLENIKRRYWLLSQQDIEITKDNGYFSVKLPLIIPT